MDIQTRVALNAVWNQNTKEINNRFYTVWSLYFSQTRYGINLYSRIWYRWANVGTCWVVTCPILIFCSPIFLFQVCMYLCTQRLPKYFRNRFAFSKFRNPKQKKQRNTFWHFWKNWDCQCKIWNRGAIYVCIDAFWWGDPIKSPGSKCACMHAFRWGPYMDPMWKHPFGAYIVANPHFGILFFAKYFRKIKKQNIATYVCTVTDPGRRRVTKKRRNFQKGLVVPSPCRPPEFLN